MIPRYSRPVMTDIWEPANKFRIWFEIEAHACDAQAVLGVIPGMLLQLSGKRAISPIPRPGLTASTRLNGKPNTM